MDSAGGVPIRSPRLQLSDWHARVLHYPQVTPAATVESVESDLNIGRAIAAALLNDLKRVGMIEITDQKLQLKELHQIFPARRIVPIEAKISDWRRAIEQSLGNTWFASHSYILIPERKNFDEVVITAAENGIGVLTIRDGRLIIMLDSAVHPIPNSFGAWLINCWTTRNKRKCLI